MDQETTRQRRQEAAELMEAVLDERITPQQALNQWPSGNWYDTSLAVAYQMLWHLEADEDQQQTELYYMDAQLALIQETARILFRGADLPPHLSMVYPHTHQVRYYQGASFFHWLWCDVMQAAQSAGCLLKNAASLVCGGRRTSGD